MRIEGGIDMKTVRDLERALLVLVLTPSLRLMLEADHPKALEQALAAIRAGAASR